MDKLRPQDAGILIQVSADLTYWEFANVAAAYLSTQSNRLQFFRSQQGFGNTTDAVNAPIYVSPVSTGTGVTGSELASPPISSETTENTCGNNNVCSVESGALGVTGTRGSPIHPHLLTAKSSGKLEETTVQYNHSYFLMCLYGLFRIYPSFSVNTTHFYHRYFSLLLLFHSIRSTFFTSSCCLRNGIMIICLKSQCILYWLLKPGNFQHDTFTYSNCGKHGFVPGPTLFLIDMLCIVL